MSTVNCHFPQTCRWYKERIEWYTQQDILFETCQEGGRHFTSM